MALAISLVIVLVLAFLVIAPLLAPARRDDDRVTTDVTPLGDLKRRRLVVYENLRDLEFEYQAKKIARQDYETLRDSYNREAATLMAASQEIKRGAVEDALIESEVAARRARRRHQAVEEYVCARCGFENPLPVKFCGECGAAVTPRLPRRGM